MFTEPHVIVHRYVAVRNVRQTSSVSRNSSDEDRRDACTIRRRSSTRRPESAVRRFVPPKTNADGAEVRHSIMTSRASRLAVAVLALFATSTPSCAQTAGPTRETFRVLFIGNSLTQGNDLPSMVAALARERGLEWDVRSVLRGGASLHDHLAQGIATQRLAEERWDVVVLQQGPSALPESRVDLRAAAAEFRPLIERAGGRAALYMVWPGTDRMEAFDDVRESYALAAADINGIFIPAGETLRDAPRRDPTLTLYADDQFHPTPEGSYAAAITIFATLARHTPIGLPHLLTKADGTLLVSVPPGHLPALQNAAAAAIDSYQSSGAYKRRGGTDR